MNPSGYVVRQAVGDVPNLDDERFTIVRESTVTDERAYAFAESHQLSSEEVIATLRAEGVSERDAAWLLSEAHAVFARWLPVFLVLANTLFQP